MSYSQRLLQQGSSLTRLAHSSRFGTVLGLIENRPYTQVLDYGCGDGWLLRTLYDRQLCKTGFGIDVADYMLEACRDMFVDVSGFQFITPDQGLQTIATQSCDLVLCTETLEHVDNPVKALDDILGYCQPGAQVVISVPIEIGPALLFKQFGRYLANLKGNYGYETYTSQELFSSVVRWDVSSFPSTHTDEAATYRSHKGFDYRKLKGLLATKLVIQRELFSPFPWFGSLLNSTVTWLCRCPS